MRVLFAAAVSAALAAGLAGCYETPRPTCAFLCGPEGACPEGYSCRAEGWCVLEGAPSDTMCAEAIFDAAPPADASVDGGPRDAGPDAALEDAAAQDGDGGLQDAAPDAALDGG
jgi:hypothetical protein